MSDATKHTVTRRGALGLLGAAGAAPLLGTTVAHAAASAPTLSPSFGSATPVQGLHLTFGHAESRTYVDGTAGRTVWIHHAELDRLRPNTDYIYAVQHTGATPDAGTFRTAPSGRMPFTFTSFGDQATPEVTWAADGTIGLDANST